MATTYGISEVEQQLKELLGVMDELGGNTLKLIYDEPDNARKHKLVVILSKQANAQGRLQGILGNINFSSHIKPIGEIIKCGALC